MMYERIADIVAGLPDEILFQAREAYHDGGCNFRPGQEVIEIIAYAISKDRGRSAELVRDISPEAAEMIITPRPCPAHSGPPLRRVG